MNIHQFVCQVVEAILADRIVDVGLVAQALEEYLQEIEGLRSQSDGLIDEARALLAESVEMSADCVAHLLGHLQEAWLLEPEPLLRTALEAAEILNEIERFETTTIAAKALVA
ncbi:MAG: hypothetical protein AB7S38_13390 [Vulcanimicrobiota bacterium]